MSRKALRALKSQIIYGISLKKDGNMRVGSKDSVANRKRFFDVLNIKLQKVISAKLVHGKTIKAVTLKDAGKAINHCDGLITNNNGLILTVTVADCLPIYFYSRDKKVIGIVHAGWRGIEKNILKNFIKIAISKYHITPEEFKVVIGPHIKKCHFQVGKDTARRFLEYPKEVFARNDKIFIDLESIAKKQLVNLGFKKRNIKAIPDCTHCQLKYYSYRRGQIKKIMAQIAYIGIK